MDGLRFQRISISKRKRFDVLKRDHFKCQYCGRCAPEVVLHVDHIDPVANGGDSDVVNLVTSCQPCNAGKSDRLLSESSAVSKSRAQMEDLQDRREQLEMMMQWRNGLRDISEQEVDLACAYWGKISRYKFTPAGRQFLATVVRKFSLVEAIVAMDESSWYLEICEDGLASEESVESSLDAIPIICSNNRARDIRPLQTAREAGDR